ncbi:polysaccharide biosynthesis C-terminal domain-containing protein [Pelosinus sp. sgz500959]|uniref:putative polysaccharide biosynthesis protein n=1 Tax=Pelosinus sp. sgz500959 TaxID=3242472 RepID=UPI00366CA247
MTESREKTPGNEKQSNSFLKGTLILTVGGIVVKVIGFLNWIILSRVLGGEGIGLYQMAFPIYLLALSVSSAGIPIAISIITAEKLALHDFKGATRVFHLSLTVLTVTGLFFSLLLYFGAELLIKYQFIHDSRAYYALLALAPAVFFVTILSSFRGYLQGCQIMTPTAVSQIVEQLVRVITMLIFASMLLPKGLEYAAGGASLGAAPGAIAGLLVLIYYYWKLNKTFKHRIDEEHDPKPQESGVSIIKRMAKLALPVSLSSLMLPIVANLDLFIVPARLEVAGYTVEQATELFGYLTGMAVPLLNLSTILTAALAISLVPAISESFSLKNTKRIYEQTASAMRVANLVTIPAFVALLILAAPISQMVYNAPQASQSISILSIGVVLLGIHQVTTGVLQGMGHTAIPVINMGIAIVFKVILNWVLTAVPTLGIKGSTWATVADFGVGAVLNIYFVNRYVGYSMELKSLVKPAMAAVAMGGIIYVVYDMLMIEIGSNAFATLTGMSCGIIVYGAVLLFLGGISEGDVKQMPFIGGRIATILSRFGLFK